METVRNKRPQRNSSAPSHLIKNLKKLKRYNKTNRVQYLTVLKKKEAWLEEYLKLFSKKILTHPNYQQFAKTPWLKHFALFKVLRKKHGPVISKWPTEILHCTDKTLIDIPTALQIEMQHHMLIQFLCYEQMHHVHDYANQHNVFLVGDMSFMVSKDSVEIWRFPHLFKLDYSVGTKPGRIVSKGENWELPPYNWEVIEKSHYAFFKDRLESFEHYYDIFRLDHASGYYAQYEIPVGKTPEAGKYLPAHHQDQLSAGKRHLSAIASLTTMLPFAEDLHFKKDMDTVVMNLGIPGIRLFVFLNTKAPIEHLISSGKDFNLMTITSIANHDLPPFSTWWLNHPKRAKAYANQVNWEYYKQPNLKQQRELLWNQMHSNSLLHIELLQDVLPPNLTHPPQKERINYPGTISKTNWTYQYALSVEELVTNPELQKTIQVMLAP